MHRFLLVMRIELIKVEYNYLGKKVGRTNDEIHNDFYNCSAHRYLIFQHKKQILWLVEICKTNAARGH